MGLVYLYTIKINEMWVNIPSSHGSVMGNGFCIGSDDAFHHSNRSTVAARLPIICYHDPDDRGAQFGCLQRHFSGRFDVFCGWFFGAGFLLEFGGWENARIWRSRGMWAKHTWKKNTMEAQKKWAGDALETYTTTPIPSTKIAGEKKPAVFGASTAPPQGPGAFWKDTLFFFPVGFCSMGFLFLTKTDGNKKNMAMSAQLLHFFYCEIYCRFFFCWCLMSSFFLLRLGLWTLGHKKLPMPLIRENKGGKLSPTLGCHHLRNKARKKGLFKKNWSH